MRELLGLFSEKVIYSGNIRTDLLEILGYAEKWNQRGTGEKERWYIKNGDFVETNKEKIMQCMEGLGLTQARDPYFEPDYIIPLGGARYTNLTRPQEAKRLIDHYSWDEKIICGLACNRPRYDIEIESWASYCPDAKTEFDAMAKGIEHTFFLAEKYRENNENPNLESCVRKYEDKYKHCLCWCMSAPSTVPERRANTYETVEFFVREAGIKENAKVIFTTSTIYTVTQLLRLMPLALQYNLQIDCVGISAETKNPGMKTLVASNYLQEIYDAIEAIKNFCSRNFN